MQKIILKIDSPDFNLKDYPEIECFAAMSELDVTQIFSEMQKNDKILLSYGENPVEHCKKYGTDGVILDLSQSEHIKKDFDTAQRELKKNKIFGIVARSRRHETMIAAECEPDFLVFKVWEKLSEKQKDLFAWYNEFFLIQSAADLVGEDVGEELVDTDLLLLDEKKYKILVARKKILR